MIYSLLLGLSLPQKAAAKKGKLYCFVLDKQPLGIQAASDLCVPLIKTGKNTYQPYIPPNSDLPVIISLDQTRKKRKKAQRVLFLFFNHLLFQVGLTNSLSLVFFNEKEIRNSKVGVWTLEAISLIKNSQMNGSGPLSYPFSLTNIFLKIMKILSSQEEKSDETPTYPHFFDALAPANPRQDLSQQDLDHTTIDVNITVLPDVPNQAETENKTTTSNLDKTTTSNLDTLLPILPMLDPFLPSPFFMIASGGLVEIDPQSPFLIEGSWESEDTITMEELSQKNLPSHIKIKVYP